MLESSASWKFHLDLTSTYPSPRMKAQNGKDPVRARAKIGSVSQSRCTGRCNFRIIGTHRASTDGLIIAAALRRDATACNSEFRDLAVISRPFLSPKERRDMYTHYAHRGCVLCALHARRVSCDPRTLKQWRTTTAVPMNKDQNVCIAIVPSLIAKSTVKCDYGLSRGIRTEPRDFSRWLSRVPCNVRKTCSGL